MKHHFTNLARMILALAAFCCALNGFAATPNDPRFNAQWHLKKINAPAAWEITRGSQDVVIAVLDTGVDHTDPDLAPNMWRNPGETGLDAAGRDKSTNGIDDDENGYVDDLHGVNTWKRNGDTMDEGFTRGALTIPYTHGTSSAGVIGAKGNNAIGTAGVNWDVSIMALRVFPIHFDAEWRNAPVTASFIAAFEYVLEMKRRGVNIAAVSVSAGVPSYDARLHQVMEACGQAGVLIVVSAGNNGLNNDQIGGYLAGYNLRHSIVVGASVQNDAIWSGSNYGRSTVHLAAPGLSIVTTHRDDYCCTSSSAPQVSGAVGLLKAAYPTASPDDLKAALLGSVDQPAALNGRFSTQGRLNIGRAFERLANGAAPAIVVSALPASPRTRLTDPITVTFSVPMNRSSVESALVFSPKLDGIFSWSNEDRTFTFHPDAPPALTNYNVTILRSASGLNGGPLDGNYSGVLEDGSMDDFKWTYGYGLPNDDYSNAALLTGSQGTVKGTTRNASHEVDEPDHAQSKFSAASLWHQWTAPSTGWITFDATSGTSHDTLLAAYTGDHPAELSEVAANDNYGSRMQSRITFHAVEGTTYSIALAAKATEVNKMVLGESNLGAFTLSWHPTPSPGFTGSGFSPSSGAPGARVTLTGTNFTGATSVLFNGVPAAFTNALGNNADLRISAVVPTDATTGPITIVTPQGSVTSFTSFTVLRPQLALRATALGMLEITWPAGTTTFVLEQSETMHANSWTPVAETPTLENGVFKVSVPVSTGQRFFRARQQ